MVEFLKKRLTVGFNGRHLSETQRAVVASRLANMKSGERTDLEPSANLRKVSQSKAAEMLNVGDRTVQTVKAVERNAPELVAQFETFSLKPDKSAITKQITF